MKVIVNVSGFYGGAWYEANKDEQLMPDAVAKAFLPPYGHQLAAPSVKKAVPAVAAPAPAEEKKPARAAAPKEDARKAD
jgi:hypothetical protein